MTFYSDLFFYTKKTLDKLVKIVYYNVKRIGILLIE